MVEDRHVAIVLDTRPYAPVHRCGRCRDAPVHAAASSRDRTARRRRRQAHADAAGDASVTALGSHINPLRCGRVACRPWPCPLARSCERADRARRHAGAHRPGADGAPRAPPPPPSVDPTTIEQPDLVLISHVHLDHLHLPSLRDVRPEVEVVVPAGAGGFLRRKGFPNVRETRAGETLTAGTLTIETVPAVHPPAGARTAASPPTRSATSCTPTTRPCTSPATPTCSTRWATLGPIDLALLPIWGWGPTLGEGHLDPTGAAQATELIQPRLVVPVHWGTYSPIGIRRPVLARHPGPQLRARAHRGRLRRLPARPGAPAPRRARPPTGARAAHEHAADTFVPRGRAPAHRGPGPLAGERGRHRHGTRAVVARRDAPGLRHRPRRRRAAGRRSWSVSLNAVVWPLLAFVVVPISVLTLGLGAIVLDARRGRVGARPPARRRRLDGFGTALVIVIGLAVINALVSSRAGTRRRRLVRPAHGRARPSARQDDRRHRRARHRVHPARRRRRGRAAAGAALRRRADDRPLAAGRLAPRSSAGRPAGRRRPESASAASSTARLVDMPAFRWVDKATGRIVVSNRPESAAAIERAHSDGQRSPRPPTGRATATCSRATPSGPCSR